MASHSNSSGNKSIETALKLVSNAAIVLTCRELLILFINWIFKGSDKRTVPDPALKPACTDQVPLILKMSISEINCETEFELLQLLDILYYTDSSVNYKIFIRNLIASLNLGESKGAEEDPNGSQAKVLSRIVLMACDFMLPEYKQIKRVGLSLSHSVSDNDAGIYLLFLIEGGGSISWFTK